MTEALKQAAQQALEQLEFLNACYPHKTAADAIAALQSALTQRPAAQTEREAFEAFATKNAFGSYLIERKEEGYWSSHTQLMWMAWQARASLPAPPAGHASAGRRIAAPVRVLVGGAHAPGHAGASLGSVDGCAEQQGSSHRSPPAGHA